MADTVKIVGPAGPFKSGDVIQVMGHAHIHTIILTKVRDGGYEGWINDATAASNYFSMNNQPGAGWLTNLSKAWRKRINDLTIPQLLNLA